jgi:flagellar basal body-associated protein FliL
MAEEVAAQDAGAKKDRKPLLMMVGASVGALILGAVGMFFAKDMISPPAPPPADPAAAGAEGDAAAAGAAGDAAAKPVGAPAAGKTAVVELESFTLNLKDSAGGRKLAMKLALEGPPTLQTAVDERRAQIRDAVITLASDYSYLDLDGADGRLRLRDEIQRNLNSVLEPQGIAIQRVYYTEFVVQ